jgi:hypothetical protein
MQQNSLSFYSSPSAPMAGLAQKSGGRMASKTLYRKNSNKSTIFHEKGVIFFVE